MRWFAFGLAVLAPSAWAIEFTEVPIVTTGGQEYEAYQIVAGADGHYRFGAKALGTLPFVRGLSRKWPRAIGFASYNSTNMPDFGALAAGRTGGLSYVANLQYLSVSDPATGQAAMAPFGFHAQYNPTVFSSPNGPVVALRNGVSVGPTGECYALFEVQSTSGPHQLFYVRYVPGVMNYKITYTLRPNEYVLSVTPNPQGGIIFITKRTGDEFSYLHFLEPEGNWVKNIQVKHATKAVYMPYGTGMVGLIDPRPSGIGFLRGPLYGVPTEIGSTGTPWGSEPLDITSGSASVDGSCWWGGSTSQNGVNKNSVLIGARMNGTFKVLKMDELTSAPWLETVNAVETTNLGYGVWAASGQCGFFDQSTGATISRYPTSPVDGLDFRSVVATPGIDLAPFSTSYSNFGVVEYDTVTQKSYLVTVAMKDLVKTVSTPMATMMGGSSPTIYAQLYQAADREQVLTASSLQSDLTFPASISVPAFEHIAAFTVQTKPVSFEKFVQLTVNPGNKSVTFKLLPPTPSSISPAAQTVTGGTTTYARLTLNARAPSDSLFVTMQSSGPEVKVDPVFPVTAGLVSRTFSIRTVPVTTSITRTVTATYNRVSRQATVTVVP